MIWRQHYTPIADSLAASTLCAALPVFVLLFLLGVLRKPAWIAGLCGLGGGVIVALFVYGMPVTHLIGATTYGAAYGLFPIGWVVYWAIVLYRIAVETGKFEIIKDSIGALSEDRRVQALLIAFAFGAFVEGAAGFGTPVAVAAAMLAGLGFSPFYAAGICLLANTAPVAFGSIGTPLIMLQGITGLPLNDLSANVGRLCAPVSLIVPGYLVAVMSGWKGLKGALLPSAVCGITFAGMQFYASNYLGPQLTDILSSVSAIVAMAVLAKFWKPSDHFHLEGSTDMRMGMKRHTFGAILMAWSPYLLLVVLVLVWGHLKPDLDRLTTKIIPWPMIHNLVERIPPVVPKPTPYPAPFTFNWLSASGTACLVASILSAALLKVGPVKYWGILMHSSKQLALSMVTIASVLGLAFLMNYCGATATMGLAFAATGSLFPFFSAMLGWLGVFLTGSDTSANALFGNLQVVTAQHLGLNPLLMASSNSAGGVMGKMISLQSIAVAAAATGMPQSEEAKLFRFTLKHSIALASLIGLITVLYAYVVPSWVR